jgi:hypothetical protein
MSVDLARLPADEETVRLIGSSWPLGTDPSAIQNVLDALNYYRCLALHREKELARAKCSTSGAAEDALIEARLALLASKGSEDAIRVIDDALDMSRGVSAPEAPLDDAGLRGAKAAGDKRVSSLFEFSWAKVRAPTGGAVDRKGSDQ